LPLAIELAATRVRLLSPSALLANLEQRLRLLVGGQRDQPARQQTLRDTIAWSYDLLAPHEQRLFRQLAVFRGGWSLEAADVVMEDDDALTGFSALVDQSLVRQVELDDGASRFMLLETIHEFAFAQLAASGEQDEVHQRLLNSLCRRFIAIRPDWYTANAASWLDQCELELDNLRTAIAWGVDHDPETALRLHLTVSPYWWQRGYFTEARRWYELGLRSAERLSNLTRGRALVGAAMMAVEQDESVLARRLATEGLALARQSQQDETAALGLFVLGQVDLREQDFASAMRTFEESAVMFRAVGSEWLVAALDGLGAALDSIGDDARAADAYTQCLDEARRLEDAQNIATGLVRLASLALRQRDLPRARELLTESVRVQRPLRGLPVAAETLEMCGCLAGDEQQPERAARRFGAAHTLRERSGTRMATASREWYVVVMRRARAQTDAASWDQAWAAGQAMSYDEALDEAVATEATAPDAAASLGTTVLSPRELDVLRLLVEGQTNQEIAHALGISPRTVINHVANMMNKLGLESRTAVAAWAIRQGVV
jgi:DNA-binding CsgD family transcriptional regulator